MEWWQEEVGYAYCLPLLLEGGIKDVPYYIHVDTFPDKWYATTKSPDH